jgi:hypothetical protein
MVFVAAGWELRIAQAENGDGVSNYGPFDLSRKQLTVVYVLRYTWANLMRAEGARFLRAHPLIE